MKFKILSFFMVLICLFSVFCCNSYADGNRIMSYVENELIEDPLVIFLKAAEIYDCFVIEANVRGITYEEMEEIINYNIEKEDVDWFTYCIYRYRLKENSMYPEIDFYTLIESEKMGITYEEMEELLKNEPDKLNKELYNLYKDRYLNSKMDKYIHNSYCIVFEKGSEYTFDEAKSILIEKAKERGKSVDEYCWDLFSESKLDFGFPEKVGFEKFLEDLDFFFYDVFYDFGEPFKAGSFFFLIIGFVFFVIKFLINKNKKNTYIVFSNLSENKFSLKNIIISICYYLLSIFIFFCIGSVLEFIFNCLKNYDFIQLIILIFVILIYFYFNFIKKNRNLTFIILYFMNLIAFICYIFFWYLF